MARSAGVMLALLALAISARAYYVPGTYPQEFKKGDLLQANVNSLSSFETEMPYEYYTMPFCKPPEGIKRAPNTANPGTILQGLRIENSPYNFTMKVKQTAQMACSPDGYYPALTAAQVKNLKHKIDNHYRVNMVLDNLPVTVYDLLDEEQEFVRPGFELGYKENGKYYINNHLVFNILVYETHGEYTAARAKMSNLAEAVDNKHRLHRRRLAGDAGKGGFASTATAVKEKSSAAATAAAANKDDGSADDPTAFYMVVGFEVSPCSIAREAGKAAEDIVCGVDDDAHITPQEITEGAKIVYTYDVYWQNSNIKWASRWDAYLRMPGGKVHWFSIMNSVLVVLVMASIVAMILIRTVRRDLAKYESLMVDGGSGLDMRDEAGWKLVTGDVFRSPPAARSLAMHIGSGVQIICTALVTVGLAALGFLSPASRGALLTTTIVLYVWLAVVAGFVAVYVWGVMERTYAGWAGVVTRTATFYPGVVMAIFTLVNVAIHGTGTSGAVPVAMYFSIVAVWFLVSIPLTFVGGYLALRVPIRENPVKTNQIPRHIPPPPLAAHPTLLLFAAGVLPFGTLFIELYFAMTSLWLGYFYYLFGFVLLIGLLTVAINAEISVLCTYVQLCAEDYRWWWRSFQRGGAVALYVALYAVGFLVSSLHTLAGTMSALIYLSYMAILITGLYLAMGTVGWLASWVFVRAIFAAVKAD
mmetsp:Transcript_15649/g.38973  ORF Transcript_15649/g.38973 Transcript_15649/m.38973 type:complete len:700 (-) Transcript_15649:257-2356(-)